MAEEDDGARPPLGSWGRLYAILIGALAAEIAFLWFLGGAFR